MDSTNSRTEAIKSELYKIYTGLQFTHKDVDDIKSETEKLNSTTRCSLTFNMCDILLAVTNKMAEQPSKWAYCGVSGGDLNRGESEENSFRKVTAGNRDGEGKTPSPTLLHTLFVTRGDLSYCCSSMLMIILLRPLTLTRHVCPENSCSCICIYAFLIAFMWVLQIAFVTLFGEKRLPFGGHLVSAHSMGMLSL